MTELFQFLPVALQLQIFQWLIVATFAVVVLKRMVVPVLAWTADFTEAKWDNAFVNRLSTVLDTLATYLDVVRRMIPHVGFGNPPAKEPIMTKASRYPAALSIPPVPMMIPGVGPLPTAPPPAGVVRFTDTSRELGRHDVDASQPRK